MERLEVSNLRCIEHAVLELCAGTNLISGANGAGKTTLLEAVHVLGRGHSFRVRDNRRLIRRQSEGFWVRGAFGAQTRPRRLGVGYERGTLDVRIDGEAGRRASQLAECLPVEIVDVAAHRLIDGGPTERRRFVDWGLFHVEPDYVTHWRAYRRTLVQRNEALRREVGDAELDVWDASLVQAGMALEVARTRFVARWAERAHGIAKSLLGGEIELVYRRGTVGDMPLEEALKKARGRDRERGQTLAGPHRADVAVRYGGGLAREVASRGQQKLLAAALILARLTDRLDRGGRAGMLLVDDPIAELDAESLDRLLGVLQSVPVQTIVTALDPGRLDAMSISRQFHVEHGVIRPV